MPRSSAYKAALALLIAATTGRASLGPRHPTPEVVYEISGDGRWVAVRSASSAAFVYRDGVRMGIPPRRCSADRWFGWDSTIVQAGRTYGIDPVLIKALLWVESGLGPRARSPKGAQGIGQLLPSTARRLGVSDPFNPNEAIWGTAAYLRRSSDLFQTQNMVILAAAYNSGDRAVSKALARANREGDTRLLQLVPKNPETPGYVRNVLWTWDRIHQGRP